MKSKTQIATFAAGCFWGVEDTFMNTPGVVKTTVGYTGGDTDEPTYKDVCDGDTGHAEAVLVEYDPEKTSYEKLLKVFFDLHNPTQVNRQGPDKGHQYRSAIFYHTPEQKEAAEKMIAELNRNDKYEGPIATEVTEARTFWKAEEYHQQYFLKNGTSICH